MLAVKARMAETASAGAVIDTINRVEANLRAAFQALQWIFSSPTTRTGGEE
jgi:hypothetical protein